MRTNIFDRLLFLSLFLIVVLLPFFCLPFTRIPVETGKGLLLVVGLLFSIIFWSIGRFIDGKIVFPKSALLLSGFGIVLAFLLSAIFSGNSQASLFGIMFDIGSFWFIFSGFILMLMCSIVFRTPKRAKIVLFGTIISSVLVLIFQSIHLFAPTVLSLGILAGKTGNVLGSWNALGIFAGFACLLFLLVIEFFPISKMAKIFLEIFILLGILLIATVNFSLVWILLGISSLVIFVYKTSIALSKNNPSPAGAGETQAGDEEEGPDRPDGITAAGGKEKHFPLVSFVVVIVSLLFFMSAGSVGSYIPNRLQISNTEVNPSLGATMDIMKGVLVKHPILGVGPNRFNVAWAMYKPLAVNATINGNSFWNVAFDSGSGLLPTFMSTTGILGILAWLLGIFRNIRLQRSIRIFGLFWNFGGDRSNGDRNIRLQRLFQLFWHVWV